MNAVKSAYTLPHSRTVLYERLHDDALIMYIRAIQVLRSADWGGGVTFS